MNLINEQNSFQVFELEEKDFNRESNFEKNLTFIEKEEHIKFGKISKKRNNTNGELYLIKDKLFTCKKEAGNEIISIKNKLFNNHPHILRLRDYSSKVEHHFCSKSFWIKLIYDYPERNLKEIRNEELSFCEEEMVHLFYQQIYAGAYLEINKQFHGNIRPESIVIIKDKGISLLIEEENNLNKNSEAIQLMNFKIKKDLYISKSMYNQIKNPEINFTYDKIKEDIFALGLIILELGINKSIQDIYKEKYFDDKLLEKYIEIFSNKYCPPGEEGNNLLTSTLIHMLKLNEEIRPSFTIIKNNLPSYEEIYNFYSQLEEERSGEGFDDSPTDDTDNYHNFENIDINNQLNNNWEKARNLNIQNSNKFLQNNNLDNAINYQNSEIQKNISPMKPPNNDGIKYYFDSDSNFYYYVDNNGESKWYEPNIINNSKDNFMMSKYE